MARFNRNACKSRSFHTLDRLHPDGGQIDPAFLHGLARLDKHAAFAFAFKPNTAVR